MEFFCQTALGTLQELPELVSGEIITRRYAVQSMDEDEAPADEAPPIIH